MSCTRDHRTQYEGTALRRFYVLQVIKVGDTNQSQRCDFDEKK